MGYAGSTRKRILLSDDEPDLVHATTLYLQAEGYEVRSAADALEAIELARSWQPDLIWTDVFKPSMSGFDMTRRLKADPQTKHIPVLILSAGCGSAERQQIARDAGADLVIAKPFDPKEVLATIVATIGRSG